ncbi:RNA polymerase sigma factor SigA [Dolichospermum sp. UHCC 0315A]|nr:RNA polymerase sigma factor SigA [Dolichospermum sp. UHCC 0315A]
MIAVNKPPLLNLFIRLREEAGLPLKIDDYLSLIRALQAGFGISNLNGLAQLCRLLWIRSETEERIFNAYFEQMIDAVDFTSKDSSLLKQLLQKLISPEKYLYEDNPNLTQDSSLLKQLLQKFISPEKYLYEDDPNLTQDNLEILTSRERNILRMLNGLDDGRKKTRREVARRFNVTDKQIREIESEAMKKLNSLSLLSTKNQQSSVRQPALRIVDDVQMNKLVQHPFIAEDEEVPYSQFSKSIEYFPVTRRQMIQTWRYLRRPVRQGLSAELDIKATINQIGLQGFFLEPVLVPYRTNRVELFLLVDRDGSMVPFHELSRRLAQTASQSGRLGKINIYYFRNCPSDFIYRDPYLLEAEILKNVFSNFHENSTVLIFSDAGAARGNYKQDRIQLTRQFLDELRQYTQSIVWLNPMPRFRWGGTSAYQIARLVSMFEFNRRGLQSAVSFLSKSSKTAKPM